MKKIILIIRFIILSIIYIPVFYSLSVQLWVVNGHKIAAQKFHKKLKELIYKLK